MFLRPRGIVGLVALAGALGLGTTLTGAALAQSSTSPSATGQSAGPPTTGSQQGVDPPNAEPGSVSAAPGSKQPDTVRTTNPAADGKNTPVR